MGRRIALTVTDLETKGRAILCVKTGLAPEAFTAGELR